MSAASHHAALMDRNYRFQRHIYDLTRKYYLLGRDQMIAGLDVPDGGSVLELGCGTGRNLILAGRRYPKARLFGLDISAAMLETAAANLAREGIAGRTRLARGDATSFDPARLFGEEKFDRVFISYALSMIPGWEGAIAAALRALSPAGSLHIVDFGQQQRLPRWFHGALHAWLAKYHVTPRATLDAELHRQATEHGRPLQFDRLYRDYAWLAVVGPI
ncbi:class I SAM-dependent methyltransferase [Mesorhizobium sp. LHD-90]|uniref:class I SAM-dependent methyltransferase n=1 Tax=Mesorhizobium sp. LHD-90 TaxID=3071414 RepID=UPI0027E149A0|nr:class I SAM-dependent methyltransferase [Mesorhizobium sp. LHD-90]MDQ6433448.1 class I SAM-dependent methyltransferase [Mesorhizobium sp. LHD-90]